ncbi:hepatocyte growth factor-regulated tyrosine kinase substrate-like [Portunus trituberculatus]|uniref:hepatocyte growth factor-regulated tyrosine kinase substrate-like n=1 Tax=Portunus trituberculatus TaxID=210409 RepID=UPI001E1D09D7|nr:hepatocyte growth factor-regulated tyrosine kinase substrate-like [Portunus trituberculatus]
MSSDINLLLEKATSPLLLDIDWDTTLHIVDLIRQGDVNPKAAVQSLVSRLKDSNPNVVLLALQVFESVVKNCGQSVHEQVACRAVMEQIHDVLRTNPNDDVRKKILLLLSTWVYAFRNEPKYRAVQVRGRNTWRNGHNDNNNSGNDSLFHQL